MRPLLHPATEDGRLEAILHALADPYRAAIFAQIKRAGHVETCSAVAALGERIIPKSSLSNHFRILRDAGLVRSERCGVEVRNHSRWAEVEEQFPGLLGILKAYGLNIECEVTDTDEVLDWRLSDGRLERPRET